MNEAGAALGLDPRRLSFSQAQDTLYAFLPLFAHAAGDQERQQIMQQMLRLSVSRNFQSANGVLILAKSGRAPARSPNAKWPPKARTPTKGR